MSGISGKNIKISIFGESHGKGIGIVIDGLPAGIDLDLDYISEEMKRRAPGKSRLSTTRREKDKFNIISGFFKNKTTGSPLCTIIWNKDIKSEDYNSIKNVMRPGHADYPGYVKYAGHNDYRGGGHFSGRLTAPLVFAGAVAGQILAKKDIFTGSHIKRIGEISEPYLDWVDIDKDSIKRLKKEQFPVINPTVGERMKNYILKIKEEGDSTGGIIETAVINIKPGIGEPFFDSVESCLAKYLFSIPAVKGVEFGAGFEIAAMKGSEANDSYYIDNKEIKTTTNNNGGILGGVTSGMPIIFRTAVKPTPSISKTQKTVDIKKMEETMLDIDGRHDPCIVPRVIPVIEAVTALTLLDLIIERDGISWISGH